MLKSCDKFVQPSPDLKLRNYVEDNYNSKKISAVVGHVILKAISWKSMGRVKKHYI